MQKIRKPLFISLIILLTILIGIAIFMYFSTRPNADHAVPYRNDKMPGPSGFSWKDYSPVGFKFLVPDNWYVDEALVNQEEYIVSKVSWEETPLLITGMVLDVYRDATYPDIQTGSLIDQLINNAQTKKIYFNTVRREGKATIREMQILSEDSNFPKNDERRNKEIYYRFIARPDLGVLYVIRFDTPATQWDSDWKKGKVVLDSLTIIN